MDSFDPTLEPELGQEPLRLIVKAPKWQLDELHSNPDSARRRLQELADYRNRPSNVLPLSAYTAVPAEPDRREGGRAPDVVAAWERMDHKFNGDFAAALDTIGLLDRAIVLRQGADQGLYYAFIGDGHCRRFGRAWVRRSLGQRHDAHGQHDEAYSAWCARHYAGAIGGDEPRRHFVDAVIESLEPGAPGVRVNYDRLLLPTALADGKPALLVVSEVRPGLLPIR
ncbi:MAG: hypothetical protein WD341_14565 [Tistlia sp.]|uniref:hypothetical protein n=1 Tax=Tistlia sp. TaxID=3057121 RepID=UPI0034A561AF